MPYKNIEDRKKNARKRYHENPKVRAKQKEWEANNIARLRLYRNNYYKNRRAENQIWLENIKLQRGCENPTCSWTGSFHPWQLDFHHTNPQNKKKSVSCLVSKTAMEAEIAKCVLLCANCHRFVTYESLTLPN